MSEAPTDAEEADAPTPGARRRRSRIRDALEWAAIILVLAAIVTACVFACRWGVADLPPERASWPLTGAFVGFVVGPLLASLIRKGGDNIPNVALGCTTGPVLGFVLAALAARC